MFPDMNLAVMISEIGIIIGCYIMTRMMEMGATKNGIQKSSTRIFSMVTFVVAALVVLDLLFRGLFHTE